MKAASRPFRPLAFAIALPLLMGPPFASAQTLRTNRAHPTARKPIAPSNGIIPLPLTPIVPSPQRLCSARTSSGLGYTILRPASGAKPAAGDTVLINYVGYLVATGAVFDQAMRSPLPVGGVIRGFSQGLQMIAKTGIVRLCIPAEMGYGARASGPIPPNSDLVFQVEMLDFKNAAELEAMRKAQAAEPPAQDGAPPRP